RLLQRLDELSANEDLHVEILRPGDLVALPPPPRVAGVPDWFVWLVSSRPRQYQVSVPDGSGSLIVLRADPSTGIAQAWRESLSFTAALLGVLLFINGYLFFTLGRWLAPVSAIVARLEEAEKGDFSSRLPDAQLPELRLIGRKLNQLTHSLAHSTAENQRLRQKALQIQEDEQRHMARELHDELGQSITAIKTIAFSLSTQASDRDPVVSKTANAIKDIAAETGQRLKRLMRRLRPAMLDELGLVPALQQMVDEWNNIHRDCFCRLQFSGDCAGLNPHRQTHLYRIVQESLTNVARHAQASAVQVALVERDGELTLAVSDDGIGFDPEHTRKGMGLTGLEERCLALGASCTLQSAPEGGVRIFVKLRK
ncbi:MAG TPA: ATP-binding protein, partial [Hyphomicrobiales bacterium]|nr:ATP-binding protein [Hyphomicrobiales bacterium]